MKKQDDITILLFLCPFNFVSIRQIPLNKTYFYFVYVFQSF